MQLLLTIFLAIILAIVLFIGLVVLFGYALSCKPYRGPVSDHFDGNRFRNPSGRPANGFKEVGEYGRKRQPDKWQRVADPKYISRTIPIPTEGQLQYTFINHSTFLIQIDGINILTDPIWSKRCSPFQWAGPQRMRPPGITFDKLPKIDLVLLSHNHYDHLDKNTVKALIRQHNPTFIVPLGLVHLIKKFGSTKVTALDWWEATPFEQLFIKATPANHFSSRGLFDRDKTLWCGYIIQGREEKLYFVGDTGYSAIFEEIGDREGPFDLCFIPIGAYMPEWFMSPIHISPQEAVQVHKDIRSQKSVAKHFGTFPLADDNPERSCAGLVQAREKEGLTEEQFAIPQEGQCIQISRSNLA